MADIQKRIDSKGNITYTARVRLKGYPTVCATFVRKSDAVQWQEETKLKIKKGLYIGENESLNHTLDDLIKRFKLQELPKRKANEANLIHHLNWWSKHLGKYALAAITPARLSECKVLLETEESEKPKKNQKYRSPATVNRYLATLSTVLSYASKEYGWINENPMHKIRKNKESDGKDRFLSEEEIKRFLEACTKFQMRGECYHQETYIFMLIALSTGARYSEIKNLKWENVDLRNKQFYFLNTKNGENRGVPITKQLCKVLDEFRKVRNIKSNYLFTTKDGKKLIDMHTRFYKIIELAKIDCRFHDLRHTVASHIAMNGGSIFDIMKVTGHKSVQMAKRYSHLTEQYTRNLLENTTKVMFGTNTSLSNK